MTCVAVIAVGRDLLGMPRQAENADNGSSPYPVGPNLKRLRAAHGLTQERLAELANLTAAEISYIENGRRPGSAETHVALARALGEPLAELFRANGFEMPKALVEFLESPLARDVSDEEIGLLRLIGLPGRRMTAESYYLALQMVRSTERA